MLNSGLFKEQGISLVISALFDQPEDSNVKLRSDQGIIVARESCNYDVGQVALQDWVCINREEATEFSASIFGGTR